MSSLNMQRLPKALLGSLAGTICFAAGAFALTSAVQYKPWGVPDHLREKYDEKVEHIVQQAKLARQPGAKPVARVSADVYDFGLLYPHSQASHTFTVFNDGESPLELQVYDSTCKCTVGKLKQRFVDPGSSTSVTLTWNTGYQEQDYTQSVTLKTNDPRKKMLSLSVRGTVRAALVMPDKLSMTRCDLGERAVAEFWVYSQMWPDFAIEDIETDLNAFEWTVEPGSVQSADIKDASAVAAWRVKVTSQQISYGQFAADVTLTIDPRNGEPKIKRTLPAAGSVRPPISFVSPHLHTEEGLVIGTVVSGEEKQFHINVKARNAGNREIRVLDFEPKEIRVSIAPSQRKGSYRLTVTIPDNCSRVIFDADHQHGYVQVGDPKDKQFSNWFPLRGAVCIIE